MRKKLSLLQTIRRMNQQSPGWGKCFNVQDFQFKLMKKLYAKNGLELKLNCGACPELYEVFKDGKQVAYYRLRWGEFRVDSPNCGDETIYTADPQGEGIFNENERLLYLTKAMRKVLKKINQCQ